ncbi:MAG TPA: biopolymer transporter ExbD [Myxococcaceae bacterium]|nr:biopolymer transporter ExbD [Myxococcaceae bacterium]
MTARRALRKFAVSPASRPNSEINVTPLVDVVLVLLIIFMVVTPLLERDISVRVPPKNEPQLELPEPPPHQLVVSLTAEGELSINAEKVLEGEYVERLSRMLAAKPAGERLVFFAADDRANYAKLVAALDGARLAGAETLGMATESLAPTADGAASHRAP